MDVGLDYVFYADAGGFIFACLWWRIQQGVEQREGGRKCVGEEEGELTSSS